MAKPIRIEKVTSEIEKVLSLILQHDVHDSRVAEHFGSITRVDLTGDLKHAKVYVSVYGDEDDKRAFMEGLESAKGFIRSELGRNTLLRYVPALHFKLDRALEEGARVISLLDKLKDQGEL